MVQVMRLWEELTDEEFLTWNVAAKLRRMKGVNYFKMVNLRRARRGDPLVKLPPESKPRDPRPILKGLIIRNQPGRITLKLELRRVPTSPTTVWASRPYNRGALKPDKCPRLGWLPKARAKVREITREYFGKHGEYLTKHNVQIVGKRIFVRVRQEVDEGASLYEQANAVMPPPEERSGGANDPVSYFGLWAAGKNLAVSAWNSRRTVYFQAVGDSLVAK
jgi:hypothetical protein